MKKTITVYDLKNSEVPVVYHFTDTVRVGIYEDLAIDFSQLYLDEYE